MYTQYSKQLVSILGFCYWEPVKININKKSNLAYDTYEECLKECKRLNANPKRWQAYDPFASLTE